MMLDIRRLIRIMFFFFDVFIAIFCLLDSYALSPRYDAAAPLSRQRHAYFIIFRDATVTLFVTAMICCCSAIFSLYYAATFFVFRHADIFHAFRCRYARLLEAYLFSACHAASPCHAD